MTITRLIELLNSHGGHGSNDVKIETYETDGSGDLVLAEITGLRINLDTNGEVTVVVMETT